MIASAVIQHVGSMLGDKAWERIELLWNFENDAKEMKDKMFNLQVALNNAEKRSQESEDVLARLWLKKYKSVAYDMEDTLDELGANAMIWRNSTCTAKFFFSSINPLVVRITMSDKMRNIRVMLDKIVEDQTKFRFLTLPTPTSQDRRESEKKDILTKVLQKNGEKESFIIPVVGLGGMAFSHALFLRVLDLSGCHVSELPGSVCKLKLLRYLDASNLPIPNLPKFLNRLLNLQTLILSNTSLKALPTNVGCLQKLQYFDLSGCVNLHELPTSFGNLSALLFLNLASCHELPTLPESFGKLHKLQFLNLSDCYKLHSLPESCCQLDDLTHLELSDCHNLEKVPDCIDQLSKLEYLNMTSCSKVQMLPESLCKLMMLKHLNLSFCVKLRHLPASIGVLRLQSLDLQGCFFLVGLPDSIFNMSTLVHVERGLFAFHIRSEVDKLREQLNLERSCVLDGRGDLWSQILELEKTPCLELLIKGLKNVKNLEGADQAKLLNSSNLTSLWLSWGHGESSMVEHADASVEKSVLEKLVPPRNLRHLHLDGYMSIDFSRWMLELPSYLPHLSTIFLSNLKGCSHLPPLGRLPNLRALCLARMPNLKSVGREFYGDHGSCWKLRMILLEGMDNLEGWWTTRTSNEDEEFLIPNLHLLFASNCPKLKFLPYPPRSVTWAVRNSDHVFPEHGFGNLSSITSPYYLLIAGTSPSPEAWHRARYLCSIENLALGSLTGLTTLPEVIRSFISLRVFLVEDCYDLETLPEWLGDLTSLRQIEIGSCPMLSSLPESIQRLTGLKKLRIANCLALSEKCQGEDKHKIAHIPEVKFE
uniref:Uncharacterized protein n=1 Tax=Setaria italica TaxID=4555 RepID=K3XEL1_SETIT